MAIRPSRASQMPTTIIMMPANKMAPAAQRLPSLPSAICDSLLWLDTSGGPSASPVWAGSSHQADKVGERPFPRGDDPDGRGRSYQLLAADVDDLAWGPAKGRARLPPCDVTPPAGRTQEGIGRQAWGCRPASCRLILSGQLPY